MKVRFATIAPQRVLENEVLLLSESFRKEDLDRYTLILLKIDFARAIDEIKKRESYNFSFLLGILSEFEERQYKDSEIFAHIKSKLKDTDELAYFKVFENGIN